MDYVLKIIAMIDPLTITFTVNILLSLFLGYIMGAERESRGKDAGISTNMFVIIGSMIFTFLSALVDPASESRIAAQIVSGIGFLGAGLILKDGANVRNLTTAASIWYAGAIGMLIGFGYHQIAFLSGIVGVFIPRIRHIQNQIHAVEHVIESPKKRTLKVKKK
jgi:putative Mg2+ transporter-C (MgtC) family protein